MSRDRSDLARLLRWYPISWQERYGDEFVALLEDTLGDRRPTIVMRASIVRAGMWERARVAGLVGHTASARDQRRTSAFVVLAAWMLFVVAGSAFAKLSEHAGSAVPTSARRLVDVSSSSIELLAIVAGVAVVAGAAVCMGPIVVYLRGGGWSAVRRPVAVAGAVTVVAVAGAVGLSVWAHHLAGVDRESGAWPYGLAFVAWGVTVAATLGAWTVAAIAVARRLDLTDGQLRAGVLLSRVVAVAMVVITAATVVWWLSVATQAPAFLGGPVRIAAVVATMVIADVAATAGVVRGLAGQAPA